MIHVTTESKRRVITLTSQRPVATYSNPFNERFFVFGTKMLTCGVKVMKGFYFLPHFQFNRIAFENVARIKRMGVNILVKK